MKKRSVLILALLSISIYSQLCFSQNTVSEDSTLKVEEVSFQLTKSIRKINDVNFMNNQSNKSEIDLELHTIDSLALILTEKLNTHDTEISQEYLESVNANIDLLKQTIQNNRLVNTGNLKDVKNDLTAKLDFFILDSMQAASTFFFQRVKVNIKVQEFKDQQLQPVICTVKANCWGYRNKPGGKILGTTNPDIIVDMIPGFYDIWIEKLPATPLNKKLPVLRSARAITFQKNNPVLEITINL